MESAACRTISKYKRISWHKNLNKFIVQTRHKTKVVYKAFAEEHEVAAFLVKLTGIPEGRLLRDSVAALTFFASYRGVSWHRKNRKWIAQSQGRTLGAFSSQYKAAAAVSMCLGVDVKSLKKSVCIPKAYTIKRFQLMMPLFQHGTPGDLASARANVVSAHTMFSSLPVLEFVSIMSKYAPFKDALHEAWQASRRRRVVASVDALRHAFSIIGTACVAYSKVSEEVLAPWIAHCGANTSHHMGPLPLCRKLGILVPCQASHAKALKMGKRTKYVRLASSFQEKSVAIARLKQVAKFMVEIAVSRSRGVDT